MDKEALKSKLPESPCKSCAVGGENCRCGAWAAWVKKCWRIVTGREKAGNG